jgi:DNA-binding NtrC family response regulator
MAVILVLDDVLDAAVMVGKILKRKNHQVEVFTDEADALVFAGSHRVDLAIIDIRLKKMLGTEVLEELKKISPETRVIMLTGYPTLETARRAQELGAFDYCIKPLDIEELEEKVAEALAGLPDADKTP